MKIALVCSYGGHLTEMMSILEAFEEHDFFFITYEGQRTRSLIYKKYLINNIGASISKMIKAFFEINEILRKEKPDIIISTGSEIAIPAIVQGKLRRKKTIFIESWCRVMSRSGTGRLVYFFSDVFLVQWPQLVEIYGKKARYEGAVL